MTGPLWSENIGRLRDSLIAQGARIRAGSPHPSIKGSSLEVVLRRTLREYIPGYFEVGSGQVANNVGKVSPQLDILVYDHTVFPHLAVNEDSSVVICCESLYASVECKATWDRSAVEDHFKRFRTVEMGRHESFGPPECAAAYFVIAFDGVPADATGLAELQDSDRLVGLYGVSGSRAWLSPCREAGFVAREGNGLELLLKDLLLDCMIKGSKDEGTFSLAYDVLRTYLE